MKNLILQATESWAEPGNMARQYQSLLTYLSIVRMKVAKKETHRDGMIYIDGTVQNTKKTLQFKTTAIHFTY